MPVLNDIPIELDAHEVVLALHQGKRAPESLVSETGAAIAKSRPLMHPKALYEWIAVQKVAGEKLVLQPANGNPDVSLKLGPRADLMAEAELALVSVVTIGGELKRQVDALNRSGEFLEAYLMDSIGVVALAEVGKAIRQYAEEQAAARSWGVSASLAPGSLQGWPIEGQFDLCALLPLDEIGVHLSASGVLVPFKSASSLIGMGRRYRSKKVGSVCRFCMRTETCWRRRK